MQNGVIRTNSLQYYNPQHQYQYQQISPTITTIHTRQIQHQPKSLLANTHTNTITIDFANKSLKSLDISLPLLLEQYQNTRSTIVDKPIVELIINDNKLVNLEGIAILAGKVSTIKAHNNILENVKGIENQNFPYLEKLFLQYNNINSISGLQTSTFPQLIRLTLSSNQLTSEHVAQILPYLKTPQIRILGLDNNRLVDITFLQRLTFKYLINVLLANNQIKNIEPLMKCSFLSKLCNLQLEGNLITKIPPFGADMVNLRKLVLSNNQITTAQGLISCSFPKLQILQLENNLISNLHFLYRFQAPKIIDIKLMKNKITRLPPYSLRHGLFPCLEQILFKHNQITGEILPNLMTAFSDCKQERQNFHFSFSEINASINGRKMMTREVQIQIYDVEVPYNTNKNFRMLSCWRNKIILKDHKTLYTKMKRHFDKLSFLQF